MKKTNFYEKSTSFYENVWHDISINALYQACELSNRDEKCIL